MDRLVEAFARLLDALGLNGRRMLWRWNQRKRSLGEARSQGEQWLRSARGRHKMCPSCRALVDRSASTCPECGSRLGTVRAPGAGRALTNLFPGLGSATSLILLVNGVFFLLLLMTPDPTGAAGGGSLLAHFNRNVLLRYGAGWGVLVWLNGEWFRMVTSLFLHGGLIHFGFNSYVLLQLGPTTEALYGSVRFWLVYLIAGLCGNLAAQGIPFLRLSFASFEDAVHIARSTPPVVGASGAIVGLIGLLLAYGIRRGGSAGGRIRSAMLQYGLYILIFSLLPGVSLLSHAGGFVGGFLAGLVIPAKEGRFAEDSWGWQIAALVGVVVVLASFYQVSVHGSDFLNLP